MNSRPDSIKPEGKRANDESFRRLIDAVTDYSIFMLDPDGIITTWNPGVERNTGYKAAEIIGKHFSIFYTDEAKDRRHPDNELKKAREDGQYHEEGQRVRKDGTLYWASVTITPVYDERRTLIGFAKVTQDITSRKNAEQKLRESEDRLRLLIESVKDYAIFMLDPNGYVVSWNAGAQRIKGYTEAEIVGKHFSIFYPEELKKINHPQNELDIAKRVGRYEEEGLRVRKDGSTFQANVIITALYDANRVLRGFAKVTRDITERKLSEDELRRAHEDLERRVGERTIELQVAKEAAEAANRAKSAFLANMSHEIRTPLSAVIGFSEMLIHHPHQTKEELEECREAITRNGRLLVSIINDILDLSKIEAGHLRIEKIDTNLSDIIAHVTSLANLQASEKGLIFNMSSEGQIPHSVHTDPVRLKQILINIIGNAIKFTAKGRVDVTMKQVNLDGDAKLLFVVQDTGPGIEPQNTGKLFAPFSQADSSLTRKFGGTGLGLILSRRLAQALGGDVELTGTKVGVGSTFTISISLNWLT